ncbi:hypothetical protein AMQ84_27120 [Paenibacillus riograndensis]|uniref:Uncharacterized protein n=1 Tax=Paenibacillus riograndensis TaxID=483937 RepID=A0A132TJT9_9BACL|nr:hypothetical protein [Paenibacillus riograndensis]KWX71598.1 hypothetical protein AMQ84_27120 [Paenibacillus riograndensis]
MTVEKGNIYWGYEGKREVQRRVDIIETRNSGTQYIHWTGIKKDGSEGKKTWTERRKFEGWVKGLFEKGGAQ